MSLRSSLQRWFGGPKKPVVRHRLRPTVENLEDRWCPALSGIDYLDMAGMGMTSSTAVPLGWANDKHGLLNATNNLSINSASDYDYFKFSLAGNTGNPGGVININYVKADGILDEWLRRINSDNTFTTLAFGTPTANGETIDMSNLSAGNYLLVVTGAGTNVNDYNLFVDINPTSAPIPPNDVPTLHPVGDQGQVSSLRPQLTWDAANGVLGYSVWLDDVTAGKSNLFPKDSVTLTTSWTPTSDLISGHTYRFWVRGVGFGAAFPWSYSEDFTVSTVKLTDVQGPIMDLYPDIHWTGVQGTSQYNVWVDNLTTGQQNVFPNNAAGSESGWQLNTGNQNVYMAPGNYRIWVKAVNQQGEGEWGAPQDITIGTMTFAPQKAAINDVSPNLPVTLLNHSPKGVYWVNDLTTGDSNIFPDQQVIGNEWQPASNLTIGHKYRIWAEAFSPDGKTGWWGQPMDFSINTSIFAIAPATTLRPTLSWTSIKNVNNYDVWLEDEAKPGVNLTPGLTVNGVGWAPSFDLVSGHKYDMWVRASGGTWSDKQTFEIAKVSEFHYLIGGNGELDFTPLDKVTSYVLYVKDLTTGAEDILPGLTVAQPAAINQFAAKTMFPAGSLVNGHKYRVFVKALNASGLGEWSDPFDFTKS
jgi:hypothetical protein